MRTTLAVLALASLVLAQEEEKAPDLHKIYVPYEKLDDVLGTDQERVMVPYQEFLELWKLKYGKKPKGDEPPVPFTVESAAYEGRVEGGIASFTAVLEIEVFEDRWLRIPLPFKDVAFEDVQVDGQPGVLAPTKQGYDLILRGKGRRQVEARFVAGVAKGKEMATTAFGLPAVPLHRLTFRVPGKGTDVTIEPARAHTVATDGDETVVMAFLGPQGSVKLTWRFQPEEEEREPPLLFSTDLVDVRVEERVVRGTAHFDIEVLRSPARQFEVAIPAGLQVLEVGGADIRTWGFADAARRRLRVALHKEVTGRYGLDVGFEGPVDVPGALAAPVFRVEGAARERGFLRIGSAEGVGVRPVSLENVFQVDLNTLPERIRGGERALGFRFPALPYALELRTERIAPLVTLLTRARLEVERRTIKLDEAFHFTVERAGVFTLRLEVPEGITLTDIGDRNLVDSYRESVEDGKRILTIDLRGRRIGAFTLPIRAEAPLDLEQGALGVPLLRVLGVDREEGTLGVYMDPGIKAVATVSGALPLETAKLAQEDPWKSALPLSFAWRWRGGDASVAFAVEARKPKVTCDVRYQLQPEEARVGVRAELLYDVQYTGVETFRFRAPKRIAEKLKFDGQGIRERSFADDEVEEGKEPTVTWTVTLHSPALGSVSIPVSYDEVFGEPLKVGEAPKNVPVAAFEPLDVERAHTYVAIGKSAVLKVETPTDAYEQIDADELPAALKGPDVLLALRRFEKPEKFPLRLEKHEYQPVADLVVRHAHVKTVIADEERAQSLALFEILNNDRQFLAVRLPEGSRVQELLVAGKPEKPRVGEGGVLLVRLVTGLRKEATFEVSIAYTHPIRTSGAVFQETELQGPVLPEFKDAPAPFQALLTWAVYYPPAWRLTDFDGNVVPAGDDAEQGSWLRRGVDALGRLVRPAATAEGRPVKPVTSFTDELPTGKNIEMLFTNGTGDGRLVTSHRSTTAHVLLVLAAIVLGAGAVVALAGMFKPLHAGGALILAALLLLAFAGRGWAPFWNGVLVGAAVATAAVWALERRRAKA